ncbi:MAG: sugar phosphate isomerase/epimerase [Lachnospiraceae bacterium]|nr:sugar phosphate isomerase/epimerase [Lachnospiraceae bacterium]
MALLISSLYCGYEKIEELDRFLKDSGDVFGGEYTFKNDTDYIRRFESVIKYADYPISFHGPLINAEPFSLKGSRDYNMFIEAYEKAFELAVKYGARHIVYHTSYKPYKREDIPFAFEVCLENTYRIAEMAKQAGVSLLVENLPIPPGGEALIDNEKFFGMFKKLDADVIIDTGHANITGLDVEAFVAQYGERVKAYHIHNNKGRYDTHNSIFEGSFDFSAFEKVYKKYTPFNDIILEYKPTCGLDYADIKEHCMYIKNRFLNK